MTGVLSPLAAAAWIGVMTAATASLMLGLHFEWVRQGGPWRAHPGRRVAPGSRTKLRHPARAVPDSGPVPGPVGAGPHRSFMAAPVSFPPGPPWAAAPAPATPPSAVDDTIAQPIVYGVFAVPRFLTELRRGYV